jgi:hypothetical protein
MTQSTKKTYYIWGEFSNTDFASLNNLQHTVNHSLNGPLFKVHLTLSGPFQILDEKILGKLEDFAMTNSVLEMKKMDTETKTTFSIILCSGSKFHLSFFL